MFRQYRPIEPGEFIIAGGDCSQGGDDFNACQFYSKTKLDIPLVYHSQGVAAQMTPDIFTVLEKIADKTGVKPVVGFERQMGGASEMERLKVLNKNNKYKLFVMPNLGTNRNDRPQTNKIGFDTTGSTRPILVGGLKEAIDGQILKIYDQKTVNELFIFIINNQGKPVAAQGGHDDLVMSLAGSWFMAQHSIPEQLSPPVAKLPQYQPVIDIDLGF